MTTAYIWDSHGLTGHASIALERGAYFSFHPSPRNIFLEATPGSPGVSARLGSLEEDEEHHGGPFKKVRVPGLDERAMIRCINSIDSAARDKKLKYHLLTSNCSTLAADVLMEGKGLPTPSDFHPHKTLSDIWRELKNRQVMHYENFRGTELAQQLGLDAPIFLGNRGIRGAAARHLIPILVSSSMASHAFCWTPGNVQLLAESYARGD